MGGCRFRDAQVGNMADRPMQIDIEIMILKLSNAYYGSYDLIAFTNSVRKSENRSSIHNCCICL